MVINIIHSHFNLLHPQILQDKNPKNDSGHSLEFYLYYLIKYKLKNDYNFMVKIIIYQCILILNITPIKNAIFNLLELIIQIFQFIH